MGLSKKIFLYSIIISGVMVGFVVIYFAFMLPSLYVEHEKDSNLDSIVEIQRNYMENRSYQDLAVKNPTGTVSVEIPDAGNQVYITGKPFQLTLTVTDRELVQLLDQLRYYLADAERLKELENFDIDVDLLREKFLPQALFDDEYGVKFQVAAADQGNMFRDQKIKMHQISDSFVVVEADAVDDKNQYSNYFALGKSEDAVIISIMTVMTPQINSIRPIILSSLPMIAAVLFFLMLIFSQVYAKGIVNPVIRLAAYAEAVKVSGPLEIAPLEITARDEIGELGRTLNELYQTQHENYLELEQKNEILAQENQRQEIFLRASSHQLKTPVTAALLLVDGMIAEVGKYRDTTAYLPEVKEQILKMRNMIDQILAINFKQEEMLREEVSVRELTGQVLQDYRVQASARNLTFAVKGSSDNIIVYREALFRIIDNLIANAVTYAAPGSSIVIDISAAQLTVTNNGPLIDEALLPHIFEPFVSGGNQAQGHGLGLYIASYCAKILHYQLAISNTPRGVRATLEMVEAT